MTTLTLVLVGGERRPLFGVVADATDDALPNSRIVNSPGHGYRAMDPATDRFVEELRGSVREAN